MPDEIQNVTEGFGGFLDGIIPSGQARAAGALSQALLQVKNITKIDGQLLGQAVYNLETTDGLPLTEGTDRPVNVELVEQAQEKAALGTGLYGTYTMTDFFGTMSGVPYNFDEFMSYALGSTTRTLKEIYGGMRAVANWAQATGTVDFKYDFITGEHFARGFALGYAGAGYTSPPAIICSNGAEGYTEIGTNPEDLETFGRVTNIVMTAPGDPTVYPEVPILYIEPPPPDAFGDWPARDAELAGLASAANAELNAIKNSKGQTVELLNILYDLWGEMLKAEQRARYTAIPKVPVPRDELASSFPGDVISAAESLNTLASDTMPHGAAEILENVCDFCTPAGQGMIATMRQARNAERLAEVGIILDNEIPDTIPKQVQELLMANGTAPGARRGITSPSGEIFTAPAFPGTKDCDGSTLIPEPAIFYDPNLPGLRDAESLRPGTIQPILQITDPTQLGPGGNGTGPGTGGPLPPVVVRPRVPNTGGPPTSGPGTGYPPGGPGGGGGQYPPGGPGTGYPPGGPGTGTPGTPGGGGGGGGTFPPGGGGPGFPPGTGRPIIPTPPIIPPTGNIRLIGGSLINSRLNPESARQRVIDCNCDCWLD